MFSGGAKSKTGKNNSRFTRNEDEVNRYRLKITFFAHSQKFDLRHLVEIFLTCHVCGTMFNELLQSVLHDTFTYIQQ